MAINLRDPSDWKDAEICENLSSLALIYQKKAGYIRAHAERKRLEVWEAKRDAIAEDEPIEDMPPLELETKVAISEVVRSVNRKLFCDSRRTIIGLPGRGSCGGPGELV